MAPPFESNELSPMPFVTGFVGMPFVLSQASVASVDLGNRATKDQKGGYVTIKDASGAVYFEQTKRLICKQGQLSACCRKTEE